MPEFPFLTTKAEWQAVADHARKVKLMGFDTETYGHDVKTSTPAYRARIFVWSIAFRTSALSPRGYHVARGAGLPAEALDFGPLRDILEDGDILKPAHNIHHDQHALQNHGITLKGGRDTLELVRLAWPERALDKSKGFRLKPLERDILGAAHRDEYKDIVEADVPEKFYIEVKTCACGESKCRKRKPPLHSKLSDFKEQTRIKHVKYPLETIVTDHPQRRRLEQYIVWDAKSSVELDELSLARLALMQKRLPPLPW